MKLDSNSLVVSKMTGFHIHQMEIKYLAGRDSEDRMLV